VLGFNLKIDHFQVHVVTASQRPIKGTSKTLYTNAYKIASEMNRLTMLCVEFPAPILASVAIYLAASYQRIAVSRFLPLVFFPFYCFACSSYQKIGALPLMVLTPMI
jgi:hypothetical protein